MTPARRRRKFWLSSEGRIWRLQNRTMLTFTGQTAVQMQAVGGVRTFSVAAGNNLPPPTYIVRNDGQSQGGIPAFVSWTALISTVTLVSGDIVEYQAASAGGSDTFSSTNAICNLSNINLSTSNPLIVRGRLGDSIRWNCTTQATQANPTPATILAVNSSGWIIDMSKCHWKVGISDLPGSQGGYVWVAGNASCVGSNAQYSGHYISNSHHFAIIGEGWVGNEGAAYQGVTSLSQIYGGHAYVANMIDGSCHDYALIGLDYYLDGNNQGGAAGGDQTGNVLAIGGSGAFIQNCRVRLGGHDAFGNDSVQSIFDGCEFGQYWVPYNTGFAGSRISQSAPTTRCTGFGTVDGTARGPPYGPTLFYNCVWRDGGAPGDGKPSICTKMSSVGDIFIGCYFTDNSQCGVGHSDYIGGNSTSTAAGNSTAQCNSYGQFIHNTVYSVYVPLMRWYDPPDSGRTVNPVDWEGSEWRNNIFAKIKGPHQSVTFGLFLRQSTHTPLNKSGGGTWRNSWKGSSIANNLVIMDSSAQLASSGGQDDTVQFFGTESGLTSGWTFDSPPSQYSTVDPGSGRPNFAGNVRCTTGNPGGANNIEFVNVGTGTHTPGRNVANLALASGTTIGLADAPAVTYVTSATTGTTLNVNNAWWLASANLAGMATSGFAPLAARANYSPLIRTGANLTAAQSATSTQVSAASPTPGATSSTVTLSASLTAALNDGVWFAGFVGIAASQHIWDNRGAAQ